MPIKVEGRQVPAYQRFKSIILNNCPRIKHYTQHMQIELMRCSGIGSLHTHVKAPRSLSTRQLFALTKVDMDFFRSWLMMKDHRKKGAFRNDEPPSKNPVQKSKFFQADHQIYQSLRKRTGTIAYCSTLMLQVSRSFPGASTMMLAAESNSCGSFKPG